MSVLASVLVALAWWVGASAFGFLLWVVAIELADRRANGWNR